MTEVYRVSKGGIRGPALVGAVAAAEKNQTSFCSSRYVRNRCIPDWLWLTASEMPISDSCFVPHCSRSGMLHVFRALGHTVHPGTIDENRAKFAHYSRARVFFWQS